MQILATAKSGQKRGRGQRENKAKRSLRQKLCVCVRTTTTKRGPKLHSQKHKESKSKQDD
jgi:hypothetical protein